MPQLEKSRLAGRELENQLIEQGYHRVAGVDEAGRGPLAGPVVAACCILPKGFAMEGLHDSKLLSAKKREIFFEALTTTSNLEWGVAEMCHETIDRVNIYQATKLAMIAAIDKLPSPPEYLLVDGMKLEYRKVPSAKIVHGDRISLSIAAASVLAKVWRDRIMNNLDKIYPEYGFIRHKGYCTRLHLEALAKIGPSSVHRMTFRPCMEIKEKNV